MPRAGNIAKTMKSNGKQFTVTRQVLTAVARDQSMQLKVTWCCRWNLSAFFKICFGFYHLSKWSVWSIWSEQWSSQSRMQVLQLNSETWKIKDFNEVWPRDLAIPVRRSNQLSYQATLDPSVLLYNDPFVWLYNKSNWISMFPSTLSRKTLRFLENKIYCSPQPRSLSVKSHFCWLSQNRHRCLNDTRWLRIWFARKITACLFVYICLRFLFVFYIIRKSTLFKE